MGAETMVVVRPGARGRKLGPVMAAAILASTAGCSLFNEQVTPASGRGPAASGRTAQPLPAPPPAVAQPAPAPPVSPSAHTAPPHQYKLTPASAALVTQARKQAASGNPQVAAVTLERALRIEPGNPLLWIELGKLRLDEGNASQAHSLARKAITMSGDDPRAQASAWHLAAAALKAQGRNGEAVDAEHRADALSTSASP